MKDSKNLVIGLLCAVICVMAVAYAAFQTTLTINGTATITSEWNVAITDIQCDATAVEGGEAAAVTKNFTGTTAQFNFTFKQPGDSGTCVVTITNSGDLKAYAKTLTTVVTDAKGNTTDVTLDSDVIKYTVSGITEGTKLAAKGTNTYTIKAEFDANAGDKEITDAQKSKTLTVTVDYEQDLA